MTARGCLPVHELINVSAYDCIGVAANTRTKGSGIFGDHNSNPALRRSVGWRADTGRRGLTSDVVSRQGPQRLRCWARVCIAAASQLSFWVLADVNITQHKVRLVGSVDHGHGDRPGLPGKTRARILWILTLLLRGDALLLNRYTGFKRDIFILSGASAPPTFTSYRKSPERGCT